MISKAKVFRCQGTHWGYSELDDFESPSFHAALYLAVE
jgi:hypothetical protein